MNYQQPPQLAEPAEAPQRRSLLPWILLLLLLIPLAGCLAFTIVTVGGAHQAINLVRSVLNGGEIIVLDRQPAVITQIRELGRLETASYTVEKVLEGGVDQGNSLLNLLLGDRLLFIAHGEVIAGVDLTELREEDVSVTTDRQGVTLRLPPARILTQRLDNDLSRVYDRSQGWLTKGDPELESRVRQEAERAVLRAACEGGILAQAELNAQRQVQILLLALDFREIDFLPSRTDGDSGCP
jgi:hypothetical protein